MQNLKLKSALFVAAILAFAGGFTAAAAPTYNSYGPTANTTNAMLLIPAVPGYQQRLVWLQGSSDKAASKFSLASGVGQYGISSNNAAAAALITVIQTNGLVANDWLFIQSATGQGYTNLQISSFPQSTNIILTAACLFGTTNGDSVFKMGPTNTITIGAVTNKVYSGDAIYAPGPGRPMMILVDGTAYGTVDLVTTRQDSP